MEKLETLLEACNGVDTVLHLAAIADSSAKWDSLLQNNIIGYWSGFDLQAYFILYYRTYNIFLAAKKSGVKRVIYASSIHAVSGYAKDRQVRTSDPVNPGDLYGLSNFWYNRKNFLLFCRCK